MSLKRIADLPASWIALVDHTPEQKQIAQQRRDICAACEHNWCEVCLKCGCPLAVKVYTLENPCPLGKWM